MSCVCSRRRRRRSGNAGVTSLEVALVLGPFLFLLLGVCDFGRYFFTLQSMTTLMAEAARTAIIYGPYSEQAPGCGPNSWPGISTVAPLLDPAQVYLCINPISLYGVSQVQVTVQYPFDANTPGLSALSGLLQQTATYSY